MRQFQRCGDAVRIRYNALLKSFILFLVEEPITILIDYNVHLTQQ